MNAGATDETWTRTMFPSRDFKSLASSNFATVALVITIGFEPRTPLWKESELTTCQCHYNGADKGNRTLDHLNMSQVL